MRLAAILSLILVLFGAGTADAATWRLPKGLWTIPSTKSPTPGLRGPVGAAPPVQTLGSPTLGDAGFGQSRLADSGLPPFGGSLARSGLAGLGLRPVGDQSPQCRTQCAQDHLQCAGDDECDGRWAQCVATCSAVR